jgi:hypothetical protein
LNLSCNSLSHHFYMLNVGWDFVFKCKILNIILLKSSYLVNLLISW